ncbi:MAG: hypothetical protein WA104_02900 [Thermodesulfovibrionales bacterium]
MSVFAMMFFQDPSILQFQKRLDDAIHNNNLRTLFQVQSIPKDSQMRDVIDEVDSRELEPIFYDYFHALQRGKHLEQYRILGGYYLINGNEDTLWVNYFEYWIIDKGKVTYHNSWVTDIIIKERTVTELVKAGRCRWKIENETFNTLKNQGYHIEHNYGHGEKHLSMNFFLLNLLAFFMHQIFELTDDLYQQLRQKFGSKRNLWDHMRASTHLIIFPDWVTFLRRLLRPSDFL